MRNPAIAAVLHEINWAETKGSGIRTMRRLAGDAGLPLPEFASDRQKNEFKVTLFLHHLLTEEDYAWLKTLAGDSLSADDAKALIYARETGMVDNTACRDFSGLDTLQASNVLRRLRDRGLLEKQGAGNRTHYTLANPDPATELDPVSWTPRSTKRLIDDSFAFSDAFLTGLAGLALCKIRFTHLVSPQITLQLACSLRLGHLA